MDSISGSLGEFEYTPRTRVIFGPGVTTRIGELAKSLGGQCILLVTDPGIAKAGHAQRIQEHLWQQGLQVALFDRVRENPTTRDVNACLEIARSSEVNCIVGLGGGSSLDTAKGCNFLLTNGGQMKDYWGVGKATQPMLPMIAIPTTAGTGSECQSAALIADEISHQKMACLDFKAAPKIALLDPVLTVSQPERVTACTGMDAIAHALETAVTTKQTPVSRLYSREAFRLCAGAFAAVLREPGNVEARGRMLLGAALAGMAIENSMLGAAHAAANPLTAHFGTPHGQAVGMLLPAVVRLNAQHPSARSQYEDLARAVGLSSIDGLIQQLGNWLEIAKLPRTFGSAGIMNPSLPTLVEEALRQWTAQFNPVPLSAEYVADLYRSLQ